MNFEPGFQHNFHASILTELPAHGGVVYYPGATTLGGADGLIVSVSAENADPWIGIFAFGRSMPRAKTGLFAMPGGRSLLVIASGRGYIVDAYDPARWSECSAHPVLDVSVMSDAGLIVISDYSCLYAYSELSLAWQTAPLSADGFRLIASAPDILTYEVWESASDGCERVYVRTKDGEVLDC